MRSPLLPGIVLNKDPVHGGSLFGTPGFPLNWQGNEAFFSWVITGGASREDVITWGVKNGKPYQTDIGLAANPDFFG
jgi:hypothetical protein